MYVPRKPTLAEELYRNVEESGYLKKIYSSLLFNYAVKVFQRNDASIAVNLRDALRFADILSKSINHPHSSQHRKLGQEIAILLKILYPHDVRVNQYLYSVLSTVGNYRGVQTSSLSEYKAIDALDGVFHEAEKEHLRIPNTDEEFFFHDQKRVYDSLKYKYYSYSGPTSMGKSFVVQTYIKQEVEQGIKKNYAIVVPTKALINEVRSSLLDSFRDHLVSANYRIVSSAGDILLKGKHCFIFVMTPERLLHMLIEKPQITIDFLFIDEAHKISERGGRSVYYYKLISQLKQQQRFPTVVFASPNIPNPEVYLNLIPDIKESEIRKLASDFSPVCQFKYYIDLCSYAVTLYNGQLNRLEQTFHLPTTTTFEQLISTIGGAKQNLVYCHSRQNVVDLAYQYALKQPIIADPALQALANDIEQDVHKECFLVDCIRRGVAYHVGYLPANIRLRIESSFTDGIIRTIFCTSTLVEGVNLPADNLFITSYKNGRSNMDEVEFRNLSGRVGRIKYNLYGNVFLVHMNETEKAERYQQLLTSDIPRQQIALERKENQSLIAKTLQGLAEGDIELSECHKAAKAEKDYEAMRKFALVYVRDLADGTDSPITRVFSRYITPELSTAIKTNYPKDKTSDDITLSYDQDINLQQAIQSGMEYPSISQDGEVDYNEVIAFLMALRTIFKWNIYEKQTIGRPGKKHVEDVLKSYAVVLLRWIRGNGLSSMIHAALDHKAKNPDSGIWIGHYQIVPYYNSNSQLHKNYVIAETLSVIENVILFTLSNYFRKFSIEYKAFHKRDHFDNDWYEFIEYGTINRTTIVLQQCGLSRDVSTFLQRNSKYLVGSAEEVKIKKAATKCSRIDVTMELNELMFNMPELFVD